MRLCRTVGSNKQQQSNMRFHVLGDVGLDAFPPETPLVDERHDVHVEPAYRTVPRGREMATARGTRLQSHITMRRGRPGYIGMTWTDPFNIQRHFGLVAVQSN